MTSAQHKALCKSSVLMRERHDWRQWGARILRRLRWNGSGMSSSWLRFVTLLLLVPSLGGTSAVLPVLLYDDVGVQDSAPNLIAALPGPLYPEQLEALAG